MSKRDKNRIKPTDADAHSTTQPAKYRNNPFASAAPVVPAPVPRRSAAAAIAEAADRVAASKLQALRARELASNAREAERAAAAELASGAIEELAIHVELDDVEPTKRDE